MSEPAKAAVRKTAEADRVLTHTAARHRDAAPVRTAGLLAEIADQPQLIATSVGTIVIGLVGRRADLVRGGTRMLAAHLLATAIKSSIKHRIDRTRPARAIEGEGHRFRRGDSDDHALNSFPSGHTAGAVAVARAAAREVDGTALPAAIGAGAVAAVQPVAGNHYLSDVIVGGAIGWAAEAVVDAVFARLGDSHGAATAPKKR